MQKRATWLMFAALQNKMSASGFVCLMLCIVFVTACYCLTGYFVSFHYSFVVCTVAAYSRPSLVGRGLVLAAACHYCYDHNAKNPRSHNEAIVKHTEPSEPFRI